jgi:hypothetical protein
MAASSEDALLSQILAVTLSQDKAKGSAGDAPIVFLAGLAKVRLDGSGAGHRMHARVLHPLRRAARAPRRRSVGRLLRPSRRQLKLFTNPPMQELADESPGSPPLLTADSLDRAIVARLIESPPDAYPFPPFHYLLGCYARASDAVRGGGGAARGAGGAEEKQRLHDLAVEARAQVVQYASLLLAGSGVVPEVRCGGRLGVVGGRLLGVMNGSVDAERAAQPLLGSQSPRSIPSPLCS